MTSDVILHLSLEVLDDGLPLTDVTIASYGGAFLQGIVRQHGVVCLLLQLLSFSAHLLLFRNHTQALRSVQCRVDDLSLEGEASDFGQVNVFHLEESVE